MSFYITQNGKMTTIYSAKELAEVVQNTIQYYQDKTNEAIKASDMMYKNAKKIVYNDYEEENARLERELKLSYGSFASDKSLRKYKHFITEHEKCQTIKAHYSQIPYVREHPTGLGIIYTVHCPICNAEEDITDYDCF